MENPTTFVSLPDAAHSDSTDYKQNCSLMENTVQGGNQPSSIHEDNVIAVIYLLLCLLGIIGNGLVIWLGIFRMKKTVNGIWFLSLAIADFSFAFFSPLLAIIIKYWPFMCKINNFINNVNLLVSILQLTVISVDRCVCVVFPVWSHNHRRPRLAFIIVLIIWVVCFTLNIPSFIEYEIVDVYELKLCSLNIDKLIIDVKSRIILEFVFFFLFPFFTMVSCYIVIVFHAKRKNIFASSRPLKTIVAVITAFFICWFPSRLFFLLLTFEGDKFNSSSFVYGFFATSILIAMSTCINPILYVFFGRDFKESFWDSLQATLEKAFMEEDRTASENPERSTALQRLP